MSGIDRANMQVGQNGSQGMVDAEGRRAARSAASIAERQNNRANAFVSLGASSEP